MSDEPPLINPGAIPVPLTAPEELESTATTLISDGEEVAQAGQDIKSSWQGLSGVYSAPESDQLVAALNPVATTGDDFSDAMDTVGEALQTFAEKAAKIKKKLVGLRLEAQDFIDNVASKDDWRDDPDNIAKHNDLISEVGSQQAAYQEAERECANKITSIFGGTTFVPADRQVCKPGEVGYGMGFWDLDQATPTPWGSPQTVDEPWYVDAWDGAVDIAAGFGQFAGGATGIYGPDGWAKDPWDSFEIGGHFRHQLVQGAASLFGVRVGDETDLSVSWASDEETWNARKEVAHSIVPWREWGDRPAYVLVQAGINIGSMAFGGAGAVKAMAQGAKGAAGAARAAGAAEAAAAGAADDLAGAASAAGPMPKAGGLPTIGEVAKTPSLWGPAAKGALKAALKDSLGLGNHMPEVPDVGRNLEGGHAPQAGPAPEPHGGHSPQGQAPGAAAGDSGHPAPASSAPDRSATPERAPGRSAPTHDTPTPAREGPAAKEPTTSQVQQEIARLEEHVKKHNGDIDAGVDEYIRERQPELVGAGTRSGDHTPTMSAGDRGGPNPRGGSGDAPADTSWEGNRWGTGDTGRPG
ncbi:hypothetical protein, partial [Nocardiopsis gilva]|uniref:hypothetical protein n=1 Tax=Nocardiopsis gilva TaxID=280236 RepID=UPI0003786A2F